MAFWIGRQENIALGKLQKTQKPPYMLPSGADGNRQERERTTSMMVQQGFPLWALPRLRRGLKV